MKDRDNLQENLRYQLLTKKDVNPNYTGKDKNEFSITDGRTPFTIEDKTQPLKTAHVFYEGEVNYNEDVNITVQEMFDNFCVWFAENRNSVATYFENKQL